MRHIHPVMAMKRGRKADYSLSGANRATMRRKLSVFPIAADVSGAIDPLAWARDMFAASMARRTEY